MDYNENERIANEINNVANQNNDIIIMMIIIMMDSSPQMFLIMGSQNFVDDIYNDIFNPASWILQDNQNVNDNVNDNVNECK